MIVTPRQVKSETKPVCVEVLKKNGGTDPLRQTMTLRHLLMHTSGFGYGPGAITPGVPLVARSDQDHCKLFLGGAEYKAAVFGNPTPISGLALEVAILARHFMRLSWQEFGTTCSWGLKEKLYKDITVKQESGRLHRTQSQVCMFVLNQGHA